MSAFDVAGFIEGPVASGEDRLMKLGDEREIHQVLMRYCRGCDRGDEDLLRSVVHPDAVFERGPQSWHGVDDIVRDLLERTHRADKSLHTVCNELIEVDGDVAHAEFYWVSYAAATRDGRNVISEVAGRYIDRWERRQDRRWRIAHRVYLIEWSRSQTADEEPRAEIAAFGSGPQSREDASYVDFSQQGRRTHQRTK